MKRLVIEITFVSTYPTPADVRAATAHVADAFKLGTRGSGGLFGDDRYAITYAWKEGA